MTQIHKKRSRTLSRWVRGPVVKPEKCSLTGVHILLVDDDPKNREVLSELLRLCGARITACESGAEVLDALDSSLPDVLSCDLGMPGMDGFELLERIRTSPDPRRRQLPAIAVTGYADAEHRARAGEAGFQRYLEKPVDWDDFLGAIQSLTRAA